METGTCKNCGYWRGLHHWETMQCPANGKEDGFFRKTTYTPEDSELAALTARVKELEAHLNQYLMQFDDESLTDEQVKHWLDAYWIPTTRAALRGEA